MAAQDRTLSEQLLAPFRTRYNKIIKRSATAAPVEQVPIHTIPGSAFFDFRIAALVDDTSTTWRTTTKDALARSVRR